MFTIIFYGTLNRHGSVVLKLPFVPRVGETIVYQHKMYDVESVLYLVDNPEKEIEIQVKESDI